MHARDRDYPLFEFASCNLTRAKGIPPAGRTLFTYSEKASYAALHFDTALDDPKFQLVIRSIEGETVFARDFSLSELSGVR
jgi:hypothetical protein